MIAIVKSIAWLLWDTLYFVTGEGSWSLRPHELAVLESAMDELPTRAKELFRSQLQGIIFVQRSQKQISHPRFYTTPYYSDQRSVDGSELAYTVVDVIIEVENIKEVAQVEFFNGRVDSIQFGKSSVAYVGKRLKVIGTRLGSPTRTHAAAIDRQEHGKER